MGQVGRVWVRILGGTLCAGILRRIYVQLLWAPQMALSWCKTGPFDDMMQWYLHNRGCSHIMSAKFGRFWTSLPPCHQSSAFPGPPFTDTIYTLPPWYEGFSFALQRVYSKTSFQHGYFQVKLAKEKTHRRRLQPRSGVGKLLLCDAKHNWPSPPPASHKDKKRRPLAWQAALFALLGKCFLWRKTRFGLRCVPAFLSHLIKAFLQLLNFSHS